MKPQALPLQSPVKQLEQQFLTFRGGQMFLPSREPGSLPIREKSVSLSARKQISVFPKMSTPFLNHTHCGGAARLLYCILYSHAECPPHHTACPYSSNTMATFPPNAGTSTKNMKIQEKKDLISKRL